MHMNDRTTRTISCLYLKKRIKSVETKVGVVLDHTDKGLCGWLQSNIQNTSYVITRSKRESHLSQNKSKVQSSLHWESKEHRDSTERCV